MILALFYFGEKMLESSGHRNFSIDMCILFFLEPVNPNHRILAVFPHPEFPSGCSLGDTAVANAWNLAELAWQAFFFLTH